MEAQQEWLGMKFRKDVMAGILLWLLMSASFIEFVDLYNATAYLSLFCIL